MAIKLGRMDHDLRCKNYLNLVTCLACLLVLCPYMLTCFTCLLCSNILHAYVLVCFFGIVCPVSFAFEKLTSKNPYIEKFLFIQRSIQKPSEHLRRMFFQKRIKGYFCGRPFTIFAKRLKSIDFSKITSFLFPTVKKRTYKPFF